MKEKPPMPEAEVAEVNLIQLTIVFSDGCRIQIRAFQGPVRGVKLCDPDEDLRKLGVLYKAKGKEESEDIDLLGEHHDKNGKASGVDDKRTPSDFVLLMVSCVMRAT